MNDSKREAVEPGHATSESGEPATSGALVDRLTQARAQYAREWGTGNAQQFGTQGHYDWMAGFLRGRNNVLEIGTGSGSGTLALLAAGHTVVSIDENPECLKLARQKLNTAGHAATYESREIIEPDQGTYRVRYRKSASAFPAAGALLLEGDVLNDPALIEWIDAHRQFDAIACWLMGTYFERTRNTAIAELAIANPGDYRLRVHRALSEMASRILPRGGVLHLVDRGAPPDSELAIQQHRNYQAFLTAGTTFTVVSMDYVRYDEPRADAGPAIKLTPSSPGQNAEPADTTFISVLFQKT